MNEPQTISKVQLNIKHKANLFVLVISVDWHIHILMTIPLENTQMLERVSILWNGCLSNFRLCPWLNIAVSFQIMPECGKIVS